MKHLLTIRHVYLPIRQWTRAFPLLLLTLALCSGWGTAFARASVTPQTSVFDPAPWQEDFSQLLAAMSEHYANLEWALKGRHMNLAKLRQTTEIELSQAQSDVQARAIFDKFLDAFGDGHLQITWPEAIRQKTAAGSSPTRNSAMDFCNRLRYSHKDNRPGINFSTLQRFTTIGGEEATSFPGGLLIMPHHQKIGIIRIGLFAETGYPLACAQIVQNLKLNPTVACNSYCQDNLQLGVANYLTAALTRRAAILRKAGATNLLIDITGNGGGTNWVEAAVRALSPVPLRENKYAFVRSEHWTSELQDRLRDVESDLINTHGPRTILNLARVRLQNAIRASKQRCNRSSVWRDNTLHCSQLVKGILFLSGILPYAKPGSYRGFAFRTVLFPPLRYNYTEAINRLPLYVAVDRNTWSAAEYFPAILQDNHAATIIGDITGGAGCGYTNGGIPTTLKNSGAKVEMPDCVRLRADGTNAVNGVVPDILVPLARRDSDYQRAYKLYVALEATPSHGMR